MSIRIYDKVYFGVEWKIHSLQFFLGLKCDFQNFLKTND